MRVYANIIQQSEEWFRIRKGRPTASNASKILTQGGKVSTSWEDYSDELIAEGLHPSETPAWGGNSDTDRGNNLEDLAIARFEEVMGLKCVKVGFVTRQDKIIGCSPDALILKEGVDLDLDVVIDPEDGAIINGHDLFLAGLECKVPRAKGQVKYLKSKEVPSIYIPQVHFSMAITGLPWYFCSISESEAIAEHIVPVEHSSYTSQMKDAIDRFLIYYAKERLETLPLVRSKRTPTELA